MVKRLIKAILFIPAVLLCFAVQIPFEIVRWIVTGKEFNDPVFIKFFEW